MISSQPLPAPHKSRLIAAAWALIAGRILLAITLVTAMVVLIAWPAGWIALRSLVDGLPTMKFNTALGLAVLAFIGLIRSRMNYLGKRADWVAIGLAGFVFLLAVLSLLEIGLGWDFGIDTLASGDPRSVARGKPPGLMSTGTALALLLLSVSQILSGFVPSWVWKGLASLAGLMGLVSIFLFLLRTNLRSESIFSTTAIHTAMLLVFIAAGYFLVWRGLKFIATSSDRDIVRTEFQRARAVTAVVIGTMLVGFFVTGNLVLDAQRTIHQISGARFSYFTDLIVEDIERSINRVVYGLRSLRGLYLSSEEVSRDEFAAMVQSRDLAEEFPGAIGFGLIERVERENLASFIEEVRQDDAAEFDVLTEGDASDLYVIKYIFPLSRNRSAWGYDIGSEATRRAAAEKAVLTGQPTITGRIELLQDEEKTSGFLYLLPLYKNGQPPSAEASQGGKLQGLLYTPIILEQTLSGIDSRTQGNVELVIFDVEDDAQGVQLYGNRSLEELNNELAGTGHRVFAEQQEIIAGGRRWIVGTVSSPQFENRMDRVTPAMIGVGGVLLTLLLVGVIWSMGRNMALAHNLMTEVQASEERAKEARLNAEKANLAKSEFLANMSHEIRTPMNAIIGLTDSVLRTDLTTDQRDYLGTVWESSNTLLQIINDILDISKIEAGKVELDEEEFVLRDVIAKTLRSLTTKIDDRPIELVYHVDRDVPRVLVGDARRLGQVLLNLVGNAIKFTEQGEIEVSVKRCPEWATTPNHEVLKFSVRDTGIGIAAEKLSSIFNVFEQADTSTTRQYGGTGLGLTISSRLVQQLGGEISVESEPGVGSTFRFTAKLQRSAQAFPEPWQKVIEGLTGKRALIVDDSDVDLLMLKEVTLSHRIETLTAGSGHAALEILRQACQAERPLDIVIADQRMPELGGYEMIQIIQDAPEEYGDPTVIVVTGGKLRSDDQTKSLKIASRIRKPVKPSELLEAVVHGLGLESNIDEPAADHEPPPSSAMQPLRILVAEDSQANQKVAMAMLKRQKHQVTIVANGVEAISAVQQTDFDVVLMDVQMPGMDGLTAAYKIRQWEQQTGGHVPIVATTAHALKTDRERCLSAGMDEYISKPLLPDQLFPAIEHAIGKSRTMGSSASAAPQTESREMPAESDSAVPWNEILKRLDNDRETLVEIVEAYVVEMSKSMDNIDAAIERRDDHLLTISAHKIKSALRFFHQMEAAKIAQELELKGTQNDFVETEQQAALLRDHFVLLVPSLEQFCQDK